MGKENKKETTKEKKIQFGDIILFEYSKGKFLKEVITELRNGGVFVSSTILREEGNKILSPWGGITYAHEIKEIVDRWDLETIINAFQEGIKIMRVGEISPKFIESLRKNSQKPPHEVKK